MGPPWLLLLHDYNFGTVLYVGSSSFLSFLPLGGLWVLKWFGDPLSFLHGGHCWLLQH